MALTFNPPDWLIQEYVNRKTPIEEASIGLQTALQTYLALDESKRRNAAIASEAENRKGLLDVAKRKQAIEEGTYAHEYAPAMLPGAGGAYNTYSPQNFGEAQGQTLTGDAQLRSLLTQENAPATLGPSSAVSPLVSRWNEEKNTGFGLAQNKDLAPAPTTPQEQANLEFANAFPMGRKGSTEDVVYTPLPGGGYSVEKASRLTTGRTVVGKGVTSPGNTTAGISYETASPAQQKLAKARYEGRLRSSDLSFRERGMINMLADQYGQSIGGKPFNAADADVNYAMTKFSTSGKMGQNALSLNTALGHLDSAYDSYQKVGNTNQAWLNTPINELKAGTNDPDVIALETNLVALQGELANVFKNTGGTDQEINKWRNVLNNRLTPQQYIAIARKVDELLRSRLSAMEYQRSTAGGGTGAPLLSPKGKKISDRLSTESKNTTSGSGLTPEQRKARIAQLRSELGQ
jgi:hypothetical protein